MPNERPSEFRRILQVGIASMGDMVHDQAPEMAAELVAIFMDHATGGAHPASDTPETAGEKARQARKVADLFNG